MLFLQLLHNTNHKNFVLKLKQSRFQLVFYTAIKEKILNGSNQLKLRCTEFDSKGDVKSIAGEFSKLEFCSSHSLQPRDLRKIDSKYINQMPAILVRKEAILINLVIIRALIKADSVILFDSFISTPSVSQSSFVYDLQERLRMNPQQAHGLPYEFRALESILIGVVSALQIEAEVIIQLVSSLLTQLEESIDRNKLKQLLHSSKRLHKIEQRLLNIRNAITEVLEQDDDLIDMYLTSKKSKQVRNKKDHDEVEMLLENYLKQVEEIANIVTQVMTAVKTTEDISAIILDSQRNSLQLLELKLTIIMLGVSVVAGIAAIFGMNLINHMEKDREMFYLVSTFAGVLGLSAVGACSVQMRKLTRYIK